MGEGKGYFWYLTGGAAESIHPTTREEKYNIEKTAGF